MSTDLQPRNTSAPRQVLPLVIYWRMTMGARQSRAELWLHLQGYELMFFDGDTVARSEVYGSRAEADEDAAWTRNRLEERGWNDSC